MLKDTDFAAAVKRLGTQSAEDWKELVNLANDVPSNSPLRKYIDYVRHTFAAHYYQPKALLRGYKTFFFERIANPFNENALVSLGDRVEETRFYFADAAVLTGQKLLDPDDELVGELSKYVLRMFQALRFLIGNYIDIKRETLATIANKEQTR